MDESLEVRVTRLEAVFHNITRIDTKLDTLDNKLDSIIRIEQTQAEHSTALHRAFVTIEKVSDKADHTEEAFGKWVSFESGRRQMWNLIFGALQVVAIAAIAWNFNAIQQLQDTTRVLQTQFQERNIYEERAK